MFNSKNAQAFIQHATASHLENLKRVAKKAKKLNNSTLNYELDRLAETNGFTNWALMVKAVTAEKGLLDTNNKRTNVVRTISNYMSDDSIERDLLKIPSGLVILSGCSGSGRTTVLQKWVSYILQHAPRKVFNMAGGSWDDLQVKHRHPQSLLVTAYAHKHVPSFEAGVWMGIRGDYDVIVVSELRDAATLKAAMDAAESGHLVIAVRNGDPDSQSVIKSLLRMLPEEERTYNQNRLRQCLRKVVGQSFDVTENGQRGRVQIVNSYY